MKIAVVGDSFIDKYCFGEVTRISPEAPVPVFDVLKTEYRPGGVLNVAKNLWMLGIPSTVFTIIDKEFKADLPFAIESPDNVISLTKTRFVAQNHQLLRADEPKKYRQEDLDRMKYPSFNDFDIIAFSDYNKGVIQGGKATIVDTKKKDLSVFIGSQILKINKKEFSEVKNCFFPQAFITEGEKGISYYENGIFKKNVPAVLKEVIDVTGAGDTVMATLIYCLVNGIKEPVKMMEMANKAAGIVIGKIGTSFVSLEELIS